MNSTDYYTKIEMKDRFTFLWSSDVFSHLTNLKYIPRWVVLSFDIFLCLLSYYISYHISSRIYNNAMDSRIFSVYGRLGIIMSLQLVFFWLFHTYSGVLRYSSYVDASKLLMAVFFNIAIISIANFIVFISNCRDKKTEQTIEDYRPFFARNYHCKIIFLRYTMT